VASDALSISLLLRARDRVDERRLQGVVFCLGAGRRTLFGMSGCCLLESRRRECLGIVKKQTRSTVRGSLRLMGGLATLCRAAREGLQEIPP